MVLKTKNVSLLCGFVMGGAVLRQKNTGTARRAAPVFWIDQFIAASTASDSASASASREAITITTWSSRPEMMAFSTLALAWANSA